MPFGVLGALYLSEFDRGGAWARRLADYTVLLNTEETESGGLRGYRAESGETAALFEGPQLEVTSAFVTGRFG